MSKPDDHLPDRAQARLNFFLGTAIGCGDGASWPARVRNLSPGGMMIELGERLAVGQPVEAELRGVGPVSGTVVWARPPRYGVRFDQPVDPEIVLRPQSAPGYAAPAFAKAIVVTSRKLTEAARKPPLFRID
ncbi:PilZ domain-containing protein [Sphingomonas changnyeongensis]|uniref:PilZ domain-containing protein n=1 Tax=Sphingomonas changnyeongensis TaxID=2698679 RepID=A0A7Z2NTJ1_9SPHN|nr:PilZ domain-containing protein [Sphingomonas changnyeongensis]QHL89558.1 PilZ domain-containing protein [Sphingomonas changnyeongensis]